MVWNLCSANGMRLLAVLPVSRQGKIILFTIIPLCGRASETSTLMILQSIRWKLSIPGKMTITDGGVHKGKFRVKLPGKSIWR